MSNTLRPQRARAVALVALAALSGAASAPAQQQDLYMVTDTSNKAVVLVDAATATVVNSQFITQGSSGTYNFQVPIEALQVNGDIWVADQVSDQLIRFDIFGNWINTVNTGLDNVRGLTYANGKIYVVNNGTANGAPGKRIIVFNLNGELQSNFVTGDLFDVTAYNGELLVSNTTLTRLERYSLSGSLLGVFHSSNGISGIDFPSQLSVGAGGEVLAAGQVAPMGLFVYNSSGVETAYYATPLAARGIARARDGRILYTSSNGVHLLDPASSITLNIMTGFAPYYVNPYRPPGPPENYCTAGISSQGCQPSLTSTGTPSASASSGFVITALPIDAQRTATFFYGIAGRQSLPWATGSSSYFCVRAPIQRTPTISTGGTIGSCNGIASFDWNAFAAANPGAVGQPYAFAMMINAQCWFRDPPAPRSTNLSDGLEFFLQP